MQQPEYLDALRRMSARVGRNIELVQAAGGNSSLKCNDLLWVKASGTWLADAEKEAIFVPVLLSGARAALASGNERMPLAPDQGEITLRASVETSLHALLPHPVVLHVHGVNSIAWSAIRGAEAELAGRLRGLAWRRLDYIRPGLPLAQGLSQITAEGPVDVLILGNHGLVVGAETPDGADALVAEVERRLALQPRPAPEGDLAALRSLCVGTDYRLPKDPRCHYLATEPHNLAIATKGSLYPDHVVVLGPALPRLAPGESLAAMTARVRAEGVPPPVALLLPGQGAILRRDATSAAEPLLVCLALVVSRIPTDIEITYLQAAEEQALLDWDAEHYRRQMMAAR
ncbi:MAG TPA: class II aldolase/adducin family protein [Candidatus Cybelea sp.]|nr:class II aldolase/adducin family protein [Candidatus Cybelea sp.]